MATEGGGPVNGGGAEPAGEQSGEQPLIAGPTEEPWEPDWDQPATEYERSAPRPRIVSNEDEGEEPPEPEPQDDGSGNGSAPRARNSVFKAPTKHFAKFPQAAWRGLFYYYADAVAPTTEASEAAIWGAHAAAFSVILGRECSMAWGSGLMFPSLHVAILGPTGAGRKSSSIDDAQAMLVEPFKPRAQFPGEPDPLVVLSGMGSGEGFMEAIKDTHWLPPGAKRGTPANIQTGRRALFVIPELGGLLEKASAGAAGSMIDFVINAWDCKKEWTHQIRRTKDSAPFKATDATAVILAASTIDWLSEVLTVGHIRNGLVNRFLWIAGDPRAPLSRRPVPDPVKVHAYHQAAAACLARVRGQTFVVDPMADAFHDAKYKELFSARGRAAADNLLVPSTNRAEIQALRLAMVLAAADGTTMIDLPIMQAAWEVVEYSNSIVEIFTAAIMPRTLADYERRVMRGAQRASTAGHGVFTRKQVWQRVKGAHGLPAEIFAKTWTALLTEGDITPRSQKGAGGATTYQLGAPLLETLDAGAPH